MPFRLPIEYRQPSVSSREPSAEEMKDYIQWLIRELRAAKHYRDSLPCDQGHPRKKQPDPKEPASGKGYESTKGP